MIQRRPKAFPIVKHAVPVHNFEGFEQFEQWIVTSFAPILKLVGIDENNEVSIESVIKLQLFLERFAFDGINKGQQIKPITKEELESALMLSYTQTAFADEAAKYLSSKIIKKNLPYLIGVVFQTNTGLKNPKLDLIIKSMFFCLVCIQRMESQSVLPMGLSICKLLSKLGHFQKSNPIQSLYSTFNKTLNDLILLESINFHLIEEAKFSSDYSTAFLRGFNLDDRVTTYLAALYASFCYLFFNGDTLNYPQLEEFKPTVIKNNLVDPIQKELFNFLNHKNTTALFTPASQKPDADSTHQEKRNLQTGSDCNIEQTAEGQSNNFEETIRSFLELTKLTQIMYDALIDLFKSDKQLTKAFKVFVVDTVKNNGLTNCYSAGFPKGYKVHKLAGTDERAAWLTNTWRVCFNQKTGKILSITPHYKIGSGVTNY